MYSSPPSLSNLCTSAARPFLATAAVTPQAVFLCLDYLLAQQCSVLCHYQALTSNMQTHMVSACGVRRHCSAIVLPRYCIGRLYTVCTRDNCRLHSAQSDRHQQLTCYIVYVSALSPNSATNFALVASPPARAPARPSARHIHHKLWYYASVIYWHSSALCSATIKL